jgi:putative endonuclease
MKQFTSESQKIGKIGEDIACRFLMKRGYSIIERNFTQKAGEIDVIASKAGKISFIEVKTINADLSEGLKEGTYRPEENVHPEKAKRMSRTIEIYLLQKNLGEDQEWQIDILAVYLDLKNYLAKVNMIENVCF